MYRVFSKTKKIKIINEQNICACSFSKKMFKTLMKKTHLTEEIPWRFLHSE